MWTCKNLKSITCNVSTYEKSFLSNISKIFFLACFLKGKYHANLLSLQNLKMFVCQVETKKYLSNLL